MARIIPFSTVRRDEPPGPVRSRLDMFFRVFGAPLAWSIEFSANAAIASYPCASQGTLYETAPIGWGSDRAVLWIITILAILVALLATWLAWSALRGSRRKAPSPEHVLGERLGRTWYLALWGVLNGVGFTAALLFDAVMLAGAPSQC